MNKFLDYVMNKEYSILDMALLVSLIKYNKDIPALYSFGIIICWFIVSGMIIEYRTKKAELKQNDILNTVDRTADGLYKARAINKDTLKKLKKYGCHKNGQN